MYVAAIITLIGTIVQVLQTAQQIGDDIAPAFDLLRRTIAKDPAEVTAAELAELQTDADALHASIQKPIPPEED